MTISHHGRLARIALALSVVTAGALGAATIPAQPASAECTGLSPWPSFTRFAPTSPDVVIGTVTWLALPDAYNPWFTLTVDDVLKGPRRPGDTIGFDRLHSGGPEPLCADDSVLRVQAGDRIAMAFDARYPGQRQRVTAVAFVQPTGAERDMAGTQHLTEARVRRAVEAAPDHASSPEPSPASFPSVAPLASSHLYSPSYPVGIDCRELYPAIDGRTLSPAAFARLCDQARAPQPLQQVLAYAQSQPDYAGSVFIHGEHPTGSVWFTGEIARHKADIAALGSAATMVTVGSATYRWVQLLETSDRITRDLHTLLVSGMPITAVRIDQRGNAVMVGLARQSGNDLASLRGRYGEMVGTELMPQPSTVAERVDVSGPLPVPVTVIAPSAVLRGVRTALTTDLQRPLEGSDVNGTASAMALPEGRHLLVRWSGTECDLRTLVRLVRRTVSVVTTEGDPCSDPRVKRGVVITVRVPIRKRVEVQALMPVAIAGQSTPAATMPPTTCVAAGRLARVATVSRPPSWAQASLAKAATPPTVPLATRQGDWPMLRGQTTTTRPATASQTHGSALPTARPGTDSGR